MFISCDCCVLSGRGLCVGLITRPEESYRVWCVWKWSWSLDNEEALPTRGCCFMGKKKCWTKLFPLSDNTSSLIHSGHYFPYPSPFWSFIKFMIYHKLIYSVLSITRDNGVEGIARIIEKHGQSKTYTLLSDKQEIEL
jgi:hypothetical protein